MNLSAGLGCVDFEGIPTKKTSGVVTAHDFGGLFTSSTSISFNLYEKELVITELYCLPLMAIVPPTPLSKKY